MTLLSQEFGRTVRRHRLNQKLSQRTVASAVGISRTALINIEAGRQRIFFDQALKLASMLGFSVGDFISLLALSDFKSALSEQRDGWRTTIKTAVAKAKSQLE